MEVHGMALTASMQNECIQFKVQECLEKNYYLEIRY